MTDTTRAPEGLRAREGEDPNEDLDAPSDGLLEEVALRLVQGELFQTGIDRGSKGLRRAGLGQEAEDVPLIDRVDRGIKICVPREHQPDGPGRQLLRVLKELGAASGVKTTLIVGGEQMGPQVRALQAGAQVVVGTPGRVLDLLNQRFLQFPWTEFAILDEADKMLEIGFIDDVKKILDACNEYRQTLLFSATFPTPLLELARGYTTDPVEIATASGVSTVDNISQYFLRCGEEDRARELGHLIEDSAKDDVFLVFCERRTDVDQLIRKLERRRFSVKALHGGYDQAARFRVMGAFRTGEVKCLVATDVASRGLDVKHVTHVVNLGVPRDVSDYTHRIGRTGRAGAAGAPRHRRRWRARAARSYRGVGRRRWRRRRSAGRPSRDFDL